MDLRTKATGLATSAKNSDFRKRIARLAIPLPEHLVKRVAAVRRIDSVLKSRSVNDLLRGFDSLTQTDPFVAELLSSIGPYSHESSELLSSKERTEVFLNVCERQGYLGLPIARGVNCGPILTIHDAFRIRYFLAALQVNETVDVSASIGADLFVIVDVVEHMEYVAFVLNAARFYEPEPIMLNMFFNELATLDEAAIRKQLARRVAVLSEDPISHGKLGNLFTGAVKASSLATEHEKQQQAIAKLLTMRFLALSVAAYFDQDEAQFILNLLNRNMRSVIVSYILEKIFISQELEDSMVTTLSTLGAMAFVDGYYKFGTLYSMVFEPSNTPTEIEMIKLIPPLAGEMGYTTRATAFQKLVFGATRTEKQIRAAARRLLNAKLKQQTGNDLDALCDVKKLEQAAQVTLITREQLPLIAAVWKERYGPIVTE